MHMHMRHVHISQGSVKQKSADGLTQQGCPYSGYTVFAGEFVPSAADDFADYFECVRA